MTINDITGIWWSDDGENTTVTCNTTIDTGKTFTSIDADGVSTQIPVYEQYSATVPSTQLAGLDDSATEAILRNSLVAQN